MKITFEGKTLGDVLDQVKSLLSFAGIPAERREPATPAIFQNSPPPAAAQGPGPDPLAGVDNPVNISVDSPGEKPKPEKRVDPHKNVDEKRKAAERSEKQKAAAAKMRAAKEAKKKAAAATSIMPPLPTPPPPASAEGMDPAEVVKIRLKTVEELQEAYANGFQKEVFELLARFGNGAKSFRELPPEAFVPIREAIDNGALT